LIAPVGTISGSGHAERVCKNVFKKLFLNIPNLVRDLTMLGKNKGQL